ncbi:hypothetical protein MRX96_025474 [Rhipicephalus microplus]
MLPEEKPMNHFLQCTIFGSGMQTSKKFQRRPRVAAENEINDRSLTGEVGASKQQREHGRDSVHSRSDAATRTSTEPAAMNEITPPQPPPRYHPQLSRDLCSLRQL